MPRKPITKDAELAWNICLILSNHYHPRYDYTLKNFGVSKDDPSTITQLIDQKDPDLKKDTGEPFTKLELMGSNLVTDAMDDIQGAKDTTAAWHKISGWRILNEIDKYVHFPR